ncbi:MAG: anti-sigma regulatory factor [Candidatus Binataceae bacterium]|nr:anti-sigma regulatory factor [Candidatus Binataceae bacterium]
MPVERNETLAVNRSEDVVLVRAKTRDWSISLGFTIVEQTKMVTAASELARNLVVHAGGGTVRLETINSEQRRGLRLTFEDQGPGIADIQQALRDGFSSKGGLGLGLSGSKRLVNEFDISSTPGEGTRICIVRWK